MVVVTRIALDRRTIRAVEDSPVTEGGEGWVVGQRGVTCILAYEEPGEGAMVPWFAIFKDRFLCCRCPAAGHSVLYDEEAT